MPQALANGFTEQKIAVAEHEIHRQAPGGGLQNLLALPRKGSVGVVGRCGDVVTDPDLEQIP